MKKVLTTACNTCPFEGKEPLQLSSKRLSEIVDYVSKGTNHLCHNDRTGDTVCRGGRNIFLKLQYMRGNISEPTDEALSDAMKDIGIEPGYHINNREM
ncbi:MAG: hypothetical protein SWX82_34540 [Cyanobacteriota bacterium]|nr:hypothetical protein [Cyanobacteriota bacterium]